MSNSKTISEKKNPKEFMSNSKWTDWVLVLVNRLRSIPGCYDVPLRYIIIRNIDPYPNISMDFLGMYVSMATLMGKYFNNYAATVHVLTTKFIAGNNESKAKTQALMLKYDGYQYFVLL